MEATNFHFKYFTFLLTVTPAWHWQHLVAGSDSGLLSDVLQMFLTLHKGNRELTHRGCYSILESSCRVFIQDWFAKKLNKIILNLRVLAGKTRTQGEVRIMSVMYTYYFCAKQNCFQEFLHASASQAVSELRKQSSFHWAAGVTASTLSLVLISMEADTYSKSNYCKENFSAVMKASQLLDFPAMCWIWQEAHFPFICLNLAISAAHYRCNYWNTQYLHNTALKLPSVWENGAKSNIECLIQTEKLGGKKKKKKRGNSLLSVATQSPSVTAWLVPPFKGTIDFSTFAEFTGKPELSFTLQTVLKYCAKVR